MIIQGYKPVENRSWKAKHRGPLLIHAAKQWDKAGAEWILNNFPHLKDDVEKAKELRGGIIGAVNMTDCVSSHPSPWYAGEWAFVFEDPTVLEFTPFPGQLSFFEIPNYGPWPQAAKEEGCQYQEFLKFVTPMNLAMVTG